MKLLVRVSSLLLFASLWLTAQVAVTTYQYDNYRSGANTHETILTANNVNSSQFGRKRVFPVTGYVYAQPLYVPGVVINGVSHDVLYVVTEHDQVYAFDVNSGQQLWSKNLLVTPQTQYLITPIPSNDTGCGDLTPEVGITGTPVIDTTLGQIFLVAQFKVHNTQS